MAAGTAWGQARNVLCVRLDQIGDVLMTTPAMRALKESVPGRRLTLLTSPAAAEAARLIPEVDAVIPYAAPWMKPEPATLDGHMDMAFIQQLRREAFDAAVIFTVFSQNPLPAALMCHLAGIPLRLAHCHENPYHLLTDWVPDPEPTRELRHEVERQLELVASVGASVVDPRLSLSVPKAVSEQAVRRCAAAGLDLQQPWVAIHPGATAPSRRYPPELFAEVARSMAERGFQVVLLGGEAEVSLVEYICHLAPVTTIALAGKLSFAQFAGVVQLAPLLIANNSGPVHVAAAVGTPVVTIYALTNPQHTPWMVPSRVLSHDVPCRNCFKSVCPQIHNACITLVTPAEVVAGACALLDEEKTKADKSLASFETTP